MAILGDLCVVYETAFRCYSYFIPLKHGFFYWASEVAISEVFLKCASISATLYKKLQLPDYATSISGVNNDIKTREAHVAKRDKQVSRV